MKIRTIGFLVSLAAIAILVFMDNWGAQEEIKVILVFFLAALAGNLL